MKKNVIRALGLFEFCIVCRWLSKVIIMNRFWTRLVRSTARQPSRKESLSSFILTVGTVDAVIGGVGGHFSLMLLGLGAMGVAIGLRQRTKPRRPIKEGSEASVVAETRPPVRCLPAKASRPALPMLTSSRRH